MRRSSARSPLRWRRRCAATTARAAMKLALCLNNSDKVCLTVPNHPFKFSLVNKFHMLTPTSFRSLVDNCDTCRGHLLQPIRQQRGGQRAAEEAQRHLQPVPNQLQVAFFSSFSEPLLLPIQALSACNQQVEVCRVERLTHTLLICRVAQGLKPKDAKGKDILFINGEKLCRRKMPTVVAASGKKDDKKAKKQ